ncbi:RagB/SusD family nutrient uptake outer membrane protein [Leeuwenhoekiella sp. H156]|uniref:RagB/SusD family nutrient uptake outer membrane protein n=1 Tax=Leeuwenhoekiella sp. H156 TaxID=3450128 RepID=UPI003FA469D3
MRNIKFNLIWVILVTSLISCNDAIEIDQPGRLSAEATFQTVDDLQAGLYGVYLRYDVTQEISFASRFTDEISIGFDNGGQALSEYSFVLNPDGAAPADFWVQNYAALNAANRLLDAALIVEPSADQRDLYDDIVGQALALRAFAHFTLLSYFTTDYTDDSALGVILLDFVPTIDQNLLRNTNGEIYASIEEDLSRAFNLLSYDQNPTFIGRDFITALRARMAAYRQNYPDAERFARQLVDKYGIANRDQYKAMFLDQDNTEIIFKLERTLNGPYDGQGNTAFPIGGGWAGANFAFTGPGIDGSPYLEMGRSLFNLLDPADIRYDVNVHPSSIVDPNYPDPVNFAADDILVINKYPGSEGRPLMNDLKVFRSSEMLLILAEARAAQDNFNGASNSTASLIKRLRDARFGEATALPNYGSREEAFADILEERRIELAFEGHRYKDLKRLGQRANQGVDKDPLDCAFNGACALPATDYRFTFPLPIVEFNANPGLREQQNPGY